MLNELLKTYSWFDHPEGMKFFELDRRPERSVGHWLFQPGAISSFHRVTNADEVWSLHSGRLLLHTIDATGLLKTHCLGLNVSVGELPVAVVPKNVWQAAELPKAEPFAFGTNVCAPGFDYNCFELGRRESLVRLLPAHNELIVRLTNGSPD